MARISQVTVEKTTKTSEESFLDRNITPLSFVVSIVALLLFRPTALLAGAIAGGALHHYQWIKAEKDASGRVVPIWSAVCAIVGAAASIISSATGGLVFNSIPFLASVTIGMTLYRAAKL